MSKLKVAISAPIDDNLYSLLLAKACLNEFGVDLVAFVTLRTWSIKRVLMEIDKSGIKLIKRVWRKYFTSKKSQSRGKYFKEIDDLVDEIGLDDKSLKKFSSDNHVDYFLADNPNDQSVISFLTTHEPDIILSVGSTIIKKGFLNTPKIGVFNVHMGILPKYRGIGVTEWPVLEASESAAPLLGVTLHIMDTGVDSGPIIEEKRIMLDSGDEIHDLDQKYLPEMVRLMISGVKKARDGNLELIQQKSEDGKQYFMLHDRMKEIASKKIKKYV